MPTVLKSGNLNLLEPSGLVQACNGIALLYPRIMSKPGKSPDKDLNPNPPLRRVIHSITMFHSASLHKEQKLYSQIYLFVSHNL